MNTYHLREKILQLHEQINTIEDEVIELLHELQEKCDHKPENILILSYRRGTFIDRPELRLCTRCGLQEKGWNGDHLNVPYDQQHLMTKTKDEATFYRRRSEILNGTRVGIDADDKPTGKYNDK